MNSSVLVTAVCEMFTVPLQRQSRSPTPARQPPTSAAKLPLCSEPSQSLHIDIKTILCAQSSTTIEFSFTYMAVMDVLLQWLAVQLQPLEALLAPGTPEMYLPVFTLAAVVTFIANISLIAGMGFSAEAGSRIISQIHAAVASTLVAFAFVPALGGRFITDADPADIGMWPNNVPEWQWAWIIPAITCGYILGDFVIVLMYEEIRDVPTVVHHCEFKIRTLRLARLRLQPGLQEVTC